MSETPEFFVPSQDWRGMQEEIKEKVELDDARERLEGFVAANKMLGKENRDKYLERIDSAYLLDDDDIRIYLKIKKGDFTSDEFKKEFGEYQRKAIENLKKNPKDERNKARANFVGYLTKPAHEALEKKEKEKGKKK